jgi:predicted permease
MSHDDDRRPPRLARWLLRRALDGAARSAIVGDLDEEYTRFVVPRDGHRRARRWYWRQAITSVVACSRGRAVPNCEPDEPRSTVREIMQDRQGLWTDVRGAVRFSVRSPLISSAVVVTLAIGVAANTAVFSIVNAAYFKKLPIAHADRLVSIGSEGGGSFSYPEYLDSRESAGLAALIAGGRTSTTMGEGASRRRVTVDLVTANYFTAIGVGTAPFGRLLVPQDDASGSASVAVASHAFWRSDLAGDPAIVGRTIKLGHAFFTIAGIAPKGFSGTHAGYSPDLWIPLTHAPLIDNNHAMLGPSAAWLGLVGVLERTDSLSLAREALAARWQATGVRRDEPVLRLIPRGTMTFARESDMRVRLVGVFVILILAIGCLNVATLLAAGVHERQKELAIRSSLGAGRVRLLRQLLVEHIVLAGAAGAAGGALGIWLARGLSVAMAGPVTPEDLDVSPDWAVLAFTVAISFVVALAVGVAPALRWSRVHTMASLQGGGTGIGRLSRSAGLWWLIPWQVALGTVLLASAGVLAKTVHELKRGIEASAPDRVWLANLRVDDVLDADGTFETFLVQLRTHLRAMPGVETAGMVTGRPLASVRRGPLRVEGLTKLPASQPIPWGPPPPPPPKGAPPLESFWIVSNNYVSPGFFSSMALPIVRGRDFTDRDATKAARVAIVNETLAARAFGTGDPIGRRVSWAMSPSYDIEIVGVVRDFRSEHLRHPATDAIFFPLVQVPHGAAGDRTVSGARESIDFTITLRLGEGQRFTSAQLTQHVLAFNPGLFVDRVWTFDEEAGRALSQERLLATAGSVLGAIALALLIVGLYGSLAAAVVRGRRELGIRLALGATPGALGAMVVVRSVTVVLVGLALGLPLSYAFIKSFAHLLYGVQPVEPLVIAAIVLTVLLTAIVAAYLPARHAARVDPVIALKAE